MSEEKLNLTQRELLIRLDERMSAVQRQLEEMNKVVIPMSEHVYLMKKIEDHETRLDRFEHFRTKIVSWTGVVAGLWGVAGSLLIQYLTKNLFK